MRKLGLLLVIALLIGWLPSSSQAQTPSGISIELAANVVIRSGPGWNTAWYEYAAQGRSATAIGRDSQTLWLKINLNNQLEGWVPASAVIQVVAGSFSTLPIVSGLRANGQGKYAVTDPALRAAEIDLIRLQRVVLLIGDRYYRLQGGLAASCELIPAPPAPPVFTASDLQRIPELNQVKNELTYVQAQITQAVLIYIDICAADGKVSTEYFMQGANAHESARRALTNVRLLINTLVGLQEGRW
jgi:uncharacterized protein YgiM (DUF1202 family)